VGAERRKSGEGEMGRGSKSRPQTVVINNIQYAGGSPRICRKLRDIRPPLTARAQEEKRCLAAALR